VTPAVRALLRDRRGRLGLALLTLFGAAAILAPWVAEFDPAAQPDLTTGRFLPPSFRHPFGTDFYSRDILTRVLYGARISLSIAALAVAVSVSVGTAVGLAAGYARGVVDTVLMRLVDAALAIPRVFLLLVVLALWSDLGTGGLVLVLGFTSWFGTSRLVRAEILSLAGRDFAVAARALGYGPMRIALRHLLPNALAPIIVSATLGMGQIVLLEAGLSYLGIGVHPPTPAWGTMIADGQAWLTSAWWVAAFPGLAIVATVLAFSLVGDAARDALDPRR
jgi:peptide/nickel transport system permease protein